VIMAKKGGGGDGRRSTSSSAASVSSSTTTSSSASSSLSSSFALKQKKRQQQKQSSSWSIISFNFNEWNNVRKFRCLFYLVMTYGWLKLDHSPCNEWRQAFKYYHTTDFCPQTEEGALILKYGGSIVAFLAATLSSDFNLPMVVFAILQNVYVFSYITNFVNHDYLFGLISMLLPAYGYNSSRDDASTALTEQSMKNKKKDGNLQNTSNYNNKWKRHKFAWLQALRGQICVVYFYAAFWKAITPAWLDGTICRHIFTSFEEQHVASGVPWKYLEHQIPFLFVQIAWCGLFLDAMLAVVLLLKPIGHWTQQVGVVFHCFTAMTMAQRIGYCFPAAMLASGLLFVSSDEEKLFNAADEEEKIKQNEDDDAEGDDDDEVLPPATTSLSHASWVTKNWKRFPLVTAWLALQWLLPARMPLISQGEYKYNGEGYR
jgi:Vitamin K-dependent gamma-carboxylase